MAFTFDESVGVSYDADQSFFDGPDDIIVDLVGEAIGSAEAFGTFFLSQRVFGNGIASSEAFGTFLVTSRIQSLAGIPSAEVVGTLANVKHQLLIPAIASTEVFGTSHIDLQLEPVGIPSEEVHGVGRYSYPYDETPAPWSFDNDPGTFDGTEFWQAINFLGIASEEAFGTLEVKFGFSPEAIASEEVFGTLRVDLGVALSGIASLEAFESPQVDQAVYPVALASQEVFGDFKRGERLYFTGIGSGEAFGTSRVNLQVNAPASIPSLEAFGSPQFNHQLLGQGFVDPTIFSVNGVIQHRLDIVGIATAEAFGTQYLGYTYDGAPSPWSFDNEIITFDGPELWQVINFLGLESLEVFGLATLQHGLLPSAIASEEVFGSGQINHRLTDVGAVASLEAFGNFQLDQRLFTTGIASQESFGTAAFAFRLFPVAIASAEAFGSGTVSHQILSVGIGSAEGFGTLQFDHQLLFAGIASSEAFGTLKATEGFSPVGILSEEVFGDFDIQVFTTGLVTDWESADAIASPWVADTPLTRIWTPDSSRFDSWAEATLLNSTWLPLNSVTLVWSPASKVNTAWLAPVVSITSWGVDAKTTTLWSPDSAVDTDWDEAA